MMIQRIALAGVMIAVAWNAAAQDAHVHEEEGPAPRPPEWEEDVLELFRTLPIQDGGRIKPLDTYAGFTLLSFNANREWKPGIKDDESYRTHIEWLVDTLLYPETARDYKVFFIENDDVLKDIGVDTSGNKRYARYSYAELEPGIHRLFELAQGIHGIEPADMTAYQRQVSDLATKVFQYQLISHYFDFAANHYHVNGSQGLQLIFDGAEAAEYSEVLAKAPAMMRLMDGLDGGISDMDPAERDAERQALMSLLDQVLSVAGLPSNIALIPPIGSTEERAEWFSPTGPRPEGGQGNEPGLWQIAFRDRTQIDEQLALVAQLGDIYRNRGDSIALRTSLEKFHDTVTKAATDRGEYEKIAMEVSYYRGWYFYKALQYYGFAFIVAALLWLKPAATSRFSKIHLWTAVVLTSIPTLYVIYGITLRCIIRNRPPITTLYETILFITATAVVTAIAIEVMNRRRIALPVGALFGFLGMMLANRYEMKEGIDTMPTLIAVLDTNFWLATHVTTVNMGYAAGVLAAAIAHIFIFGKLFGIKKNEPKFYRDITKMVYGVICFGVVFSTVGTVLGGIWANDSWGRFWGWDPKENGALMIVLWQLFMLHGRMGGYLKQHGFNNMAVFGGMIVMFSWWHVNHLGVGLHAYGFTEGIIGNLMKYYGLQTFVLLCGLAAFILDKRRGSKPAAQPKGELTEAITK